MEIKKLVESIISKLLENADINSIFMNVQALAHLLKNEQFSQWVKSEVFGYVDDNLPIYRITTVSIKGYIEQNRGFEGKLLLDDYPLPLLKIPSEIRISLTNYKCKEPINQVQKLAKSDNTLHKQFSSDMFSLFQKSLPNNCSIYRVWQEVNPIFFLNIVEQVKSKLLQFLLELNDSLNLNVDLEKIDKKDNLDRLVNTIIYATNVNTGDNSNIISNNSNIIGGVGNIVIISNEIRKKLEKIVDDIETATNELEVNVNDKNEILEKIENIREVLNNEKSSPSLVKNTFNFLKTIGNALIVSKITPYVDMALSLINSTFT